MERGKEEDKGRANSRNAALQLASTEEIGQRLAKPTPPFWSTEDESCYRSLRNSREVKIERGGEKRLEDYIDPVILARISSKIWGIRVGLEEKAEKWEVKRAVFLESPTEECPNFSSSVRSVRQRIALSDITRETNQQ